MYTLKVENSNGDLLDLTASSAYEVYKINGLQPVKASINQSVNATEDGMSINSTRLDSRNIIIYLTIEPDVETNRINLYKYFSPKRQVKLYFKNDTRDVYIEGTVELIECDLFSKRQIAQISIICPRPYFKGVDELNVTFSDVGSGFEFPFAISAGGIELSTVGSNTRKSIVNVGDVDSGIVISLFATGTVINPVLYDTFHKTKMLLNCEMLEGDTIIINTNVGEKSIRRIRDGISSNVLGYLSPDSTWFVLESGDNVYTYDATSGNSNLQIKFTSSLLYGGV